jgi:hypothetical protein
MGYIIKAPTGGGGGDATAANQVIQINELKIDSTEPSVFKVEAGLSGDKSVFTDYNGFSTFNDELRNSVFKFNDKSIFEKTKISYASGLVGTNCVSFQNATPALLAADIQTFLRTGQYAIINICYADAGGVAPNPHTALIIYNDI